MPGNGDKGPWHQYKRPPGVTEMFARELGDRWLGMDNGEQDGEQDGRWSGSFSGGFTPYGADRLQRYYHCQRHFEGNMTSSKWAKICKASQDTASREKRRSGGLVSGRGRAGRRRT